MVLRGVEIRKWTENLLGTADKKIRGMTKLVIYPMWIFYDHYKNNLVGCLTW